MHVVFLGGASEVGASCLAAEIAGQWIIIDAGVRMDRKRDPLPDLALLEGKDIKAIFVTHAHADHIGALPLIHQIFPTVPIFASRATGLLMEVMLSDALKIMSRRAAEEMDIPLYPPELVNAMLDHLRPLPVGESLTLPQLPGITVYASRAGHIAGAVSFAFTSTDGTLVVSGDISSTPQRTVLGAQAPPVQRCDLLVMESTYGTRLHPNRQGEELRLSQAVAENIARGGHTLIPCFGLGRGQEILLILRAAQEKGLIPDFPIYVDGLVRRVCSTYVLVPEALSPTLQRQINRGYVPFSAPTISFVQGERDRERLLKGPPGCILSSSGMLTGGPSVWYAKHLAPQDNAAIFFSGYQDEESPGRRLLDLEERRTGTLDLDGIQVPVRCRVEKFNISAHADGGELAAYAAALKPRKVALVHGDQEARRALQHLLTKTEVVLPENGEQLLSHGGEKKQCLVSKQSPVLPMLPSQIGEGGKLTSETLPNLWQAISKVPSSRIVTARELAQIWYGEANEENTSTVVTTLSGDYEQRYFVHQQALEEAYRVRGQGEEGLSDFLRDLVGKILLIEVSPGSSKPVLCLSIERGTKVRVQHPRGVDFTHSRYPFTAILEVLGEYTSEMRDEQASVEAGLENLMKNARRLRRRHSAYTLARHCKEGVAYTLRELAQFAGVDVGDITERLVVAKNLYSHPLLFRQQRTPITGEGVALYSLASEWQEALSTPEAIPPPDQQRTQEIIEQFLGNAPDLYRRGIDPLTGDVTLSFHFPAVAQKRYASSIEKIVDGAEVRVTIAPQTHQGELLKVAQQLLPPGLTGQGSHSVYVERKLLQLKCMGTARAEEVQSTVELFHAQTDWKLELMIQSEESMSSPKLVKNRTSTRMNQNNAVETAQQLVKDLPDYVKVGAEPNRWVLHVRFHFPVVARQRYSPLLDEICTQTGWGVDIADDVHQDALAQMAQHVLPQGLSLAKAPSIFHNRMAVVLKYKGTATQEAISAAQQRFTEETGWTLYLETVEKQ